MGIFQKKQVQDINNDGVIDYNDRLRQNTNHPSFRIEDMMFGKGKNLPRMQVRELDEHSPMKISRVNSQALDALPFLMSQPLFRKKHN